MNKTSREKNYQSRLASTTLDENVIQPWRSFGVGQASGLKGRPDFRKKLRVALYPSSETSCLITIIMIIICGLLMYTTL